MKSSNPPDYTPTEILDIGRLIDRAQYREALDAMESYIEKDPNDMTVNFYKSSLFVDIGFRLRDEALIRRGLDAGEAIVVDPAAESYWLSTHYNLSNAYIDLFFLSEWRSGPESTIKPESAPLSKNLQRAKQHLRKVISSNADLSQDFNKQLWVNYGNCLDTLGRGVEAFIAYDRALQYDRNFSMAIGNKAKASMLFAQISGKYGKSIYAHAYHEIKSIINNPDLIKFGGLDAKEHFENRLLYIENLFKDEKEFLAKPIEHPPYDMTGISPFERFYISYCRKERLFLNFHIHDDQCEAALCDPIFIRFLIDPKESDPFAMPYRFAKYINQIKEDFAVARLLLVQSQYKRGDFNSISTRTTFVYCLDYSIFNLYIGLLKSAFKEAYNILDKIAVFINDYYSLGLDEEKIGFISIRDNRCIWQKAGDIREEILASKNISLYALYDLFLDFKSGYYDKIKSIRHAMTHRKLVVFNTRVISCDINDPKHEIDYDTLLQTTADLLRFVKGAIIYLINFVNTEESKKLKDEDGNFTIPLDTTQYFDTPPFIGDENDLRST